MSYFLAIDQGTTGTTAVLVDAKNFIFLDKVNKEYKQIYPQPGWVEHNLNDIWQTVEETVSQVLKKTNIQASSIIGIGITNQRETTCAFDLNGTPLANAIVWQDRRTHDFCKSLKDSGHEDSVRTKTGLPLDPYFSATKMRWLLDNNKQVQNALAKNELRLGTIDTFLLAKLTSNISFATEASNASRTLLMDLETSTWSSELTDLFQIPLSTLPTIENSFHHFGKTKGLSFLPDGIPITGILGDQQAALFGQTGIHKGDMKCTYGTGAFLLLNTGSEMVRSKNGLLTTVAYRNNNKTVYALEGSAYIAGAAVQWMRDNLGLFVSSPEVESLALEVKNINEMKNLLFMPFFTGIGSPYWIADAQAAIIGLTRDTNKAHLSRACLEGIAFSINDLIQAMKQDTKLEIKSLRVDGGAVSNNLLLTIQSTISELDIVRPQVIETTAYGAALAAAQGLGQLNLEDLKEYWKEDKVFVPEEKWVSFYKEKVQQWTSSLKKLYT